MPKTASSDQHEFRTAVKVPIAQFGTIVGLVWLLYGLRLCGIDLLGLMSRNRISTEPIPGSTYLVIAAVVSIFAIPLLVLQLHKNRRLLKHGLRTEARFVSRSILRRNGVVPVTFAYTVNGVEYTQRRDVSATQADTYDQDTRVPAIVDPKNPRRCLISPYQVIGG